MKARIFPSLFRLAAVALLAGFAIGAGASPASANAFNKLKGSWRGGGTVSPVGGASEKVACRVSYGVAGASVTQSITCAGTDYRISANASLKLSNTKSAGSVSGSWRETIYNVGGGANGSFSGNRINVFISGDKFSGRMTISVKGRSHTVSITQFDAGTGKYTSMANIRLRR
ncbi:MAG: hypothetical protein ACR2PO_15135 [Methyloligellaceae bacterium]